MTGFYGASEKCLSLYSILLNLHFKPLILSFHLWVFRIMSSFLSILWMRPMRNEVFFFFPFFKTDFWIPVPTFSLSSTFRWPFLADGNTWNAIEMGGRGEQPRSRGGEGRGLAEGEAPRRTCPATHSNVPRTRLSQTGWIKHPSDPPCINVPCVYRNSAPVRH